MAANKIYKLAIKFSKLIAKLAAESNRAIKSHKQFRHYNCLSTVYKQPFLYDYL